MTTNCVTCGGRSAPRSTNAMAALLYCLAVVFAFPLLGMMGLNTFMFVAPAIVLFLHMMLAVLDGNDNNKGVAASEIDQEAEDLTSYLLTCLQLDAKVASWRPSHSRTPSGQTIVTNLVYHKVRDSITTNAWRLPSDRTEPATRNPSRNTSRKASVSTHTTVSEAPTRKEEDIVSCLDVDVVEEALPGIAWANNFPSIFVDSIEWNAFANCAFDNVKWDNFVVPLTGLLGLAKDTFHLASEKVSSEDEAYNGKSKDLVDEDGCELENNAVFSDVDSSESEHSVADEDVNELVFDTVLPDIDGGAPEDNAAWNDIDSDSSEEGEPGITMLDIDSDDSEADGCDEEEQRIIIRNIDSAIKSDDEKVVISKDVVLQRMPLTEANLEDFKTIRKKEEDVAGGIEYVKRCLHMPPTSDNEPDLTEDQSIEYVDGDWDLPPATLCPLTGTVLGGLETNDYETVILDLTTVQNVLVRMENAQAIYVFPLHGVMQFRADHIESVRKKVAQPSTVQTQRVFPYSVKLNDMCPGTTIWSTCPVPKIYFNFQMFSEEYPEGFPSTAAETTWCLEELSPMGFTDCVIQHARFARDEKFRKVLGESYTLLPMNTLSWTMSEMSSDIAKIKSKQTWHFKTRTGDRLVECGKVSNAWFLQENQPWDERHNSNVPIPPEGFWNPASGYQQWRFDEVPLMKFDSGVVYGRGAFYEHVAAQTWERCKQAAREFATVLAARTGENLLDPAWLLLNDNSGLIVPPRVETVGPASSLHWNNGCPVPYHDEEEDAFCVALRNRHYDKNDPSVCCHSNVWSDDDCWHWWYDVRTVNEFEVDPLVALFTDKEQAARTPHLKAWIEEMRSRVGLGDTKFWTGDSAFVPMHPEVAARREAAGFFPYSGIMAADKAIPSREEFFKTVSLVWETSIDEVTNQRTTIVTMKPQEGAATAQQMGYRPFEVLSSAQFEEWQRKVQGKVVGELGTTEGLREWETLDGMVD